MLIIKEILKKLIDRRRSGIWCFNFHQVAKVFCEKLHMRGTFTSFSDFERYIDYIRNNFDLVSLSVAIDMQKNKNIDARYACITFDDGDSGIEDVIPFLISESVPASFFLNSAYMIIDKIDPFRVANFLLHDSTAGVCRDSLIKLTSTLRRTMCSSEFNSAKQELLKLWDSIQDLSYKPYASQRFLHSIDNPLINFGLHGHEHDRFILMDYIDQKNSLLNNIQFVSQLSGYIPVFAIPFGRPLDWNGLTIDVCNELKLAYLFANGGYNFGDGVGLKRIPVDNRNILFDLRCGYYQ